MTDVVTARYTTITGSVFPDKPTSAKLSNFIQDTIANYPPIGDRQYNIQINVKLNSTKLSLKPDASFVNGGTPTGIHWITLNDVSLLAIKALLEYGCILRPGIKLNGTSYKKHFVGADFVYFDIDSDHKIQASIESEFLPSTYIYKTPGYDAGLEHGLEKHRVLTKLSRRLTDPYQVEAIIRFYLKFLDYLDPACPDSTRIMYGSLYPVVFFNPDGEINVDELEQNDLYQQIYDEIITNNGTKTKDSVTAKKKTQQPEKILPIHAELIKKLEEDYQLDLNAFLEPLNLGYDFEFKRINPDHVSILYKWVGLNPFSPSNNSGTSLVCSVKDGKIIFYNRARTADKDALEDGKHGATIFDFIACIRRKKATIESVNTKEEFNIVSKELCDSYQLPIGLTIDLKKLDIVEILENYLHPELAGRIYRCKNVIGDTVSEKDIYLLYKNCGKWQRGFKNMCCSIFETTYQQMFGVMMDSYKHGNLGNGGSFEQFPINACLETVPHENLDYFYFRNGMFNYETKQLEPYTPDVFNFYQVPYDFKSDHHAAKDAFKWLSKCLKASGVCSKDRKIIYLSFLLTVHQKFHLTLKFLYLYGIKGSGKSTLAQIFCAIFPDDSVFQSAEVVRKADKHYGKFINRVTVWDEVISMTGIIPTLMTFIRSATKHGIKFNYEDKYVPSFDKTIPATVIFTGETFTIGTTKNVEGFTDRVVSVEFNTSQLATNKALWSRWYAEKDALIESLVSVAAAITFDPKWVETINQIQLREDSVYAERMATLKATADPFFQYIEKFEVDPLFTCDDDRKNPEMKFLTSKRLKQIYTEITGDDSAKYASVWNNIAQKTARKFKEINPLAVNVKKLNQGMVWYGIKLNDEVLAEYPQLNHF